MTAVGSGSWLRRFHPKAGAKARLVCLPHAGGAASYFHPLSRLLESSSIDVVVVQYPGRQDRSAEPLVGDITAMAEHVTDALRGWTDEPLAFFGHSMGATVAFETARRMEAMGVGVTSLFVSARPAPSIPPSRKFDIHNEEALVADVVSLDSAAAELLQDPDIRAMALPAIRNDYSAVATYRYLPGRDVTCPIVALLGNADPRVTHEEAQAWSKHTTGAFELRSFSGGHFYLNNHRETVANMIAERLLA